MPNVSQSLEDYLEAIYRLGGETSGARITDIAAQTGFSKPSVNRAVKTLAAHGYAEHEPYGLITLTPAGREIARAVHNRHVMIRRFLTEQLGVADETAEQDACRMEHVISEETMQKLIAYLAKLIG